MDIISAYREVGSYRGAAAISGTTPKTVRRVIARHESGGAPPARVPRGHNYDAVVDLVAERVERSKGRISAKRLLPAARAAGYEGSARNFGRLVSTRKALWRDDNHRGRRPAVWSPGEHLVIDWGVLGGLHVFCAVLAWCRVRFVRFADNERADTTLALLAECFDHLGGVPGVVLADRMGRLKGGVVANTVVPTAQYVRFASHHGFRPDFCEAADPESKGIVENLVGYAKTDLMIPGVDGSGDPFTDLGAANTAAATWCVQVNAVMHSEICAVPAERLIIERELLAALPSLRASIGRSVTRKVDRLACVRFGSARYSVPVRFIGEQVRLHVEADRTLSIMAGRGEARWSPSTCLSRRARSRSTMITTAGRARRHSGRCVRKPWRRRRSARSVRPRRRSSPALPRRGTPAWARSWPSSTRWPPRTASNPSSTHWPGRSRSAAGGPRTSGPSSPPAPQHPSPPPPGTPSCSSCPASRPAHCRTTPCSLPRVERREHVRAGARTRSCRRAAPTQARRDASTCPRAAAHREDPAVGAGGAVTDPGRGRDQRSGRLQRPHPAQDRSVPGREDPRRLPPRRAHDHPRHPRLPRQPGMDHREGDPVPGRAGRHRQEPPARRARRRRRDRGAPGPLLHRRRPRRNPLPRTGRQQRRPRDRHPAPQRPAHLRRSRVRPTRRHRRATAVPVHRRRL